MSENRPGRSRWPWLFLALNLAAIAVWFHLSGFFAPGRLELTACAPSGEEIDAEAVDHIDVEFAGPIDPDSVESDAVRLHPPASGETELVDGRILRFRLREKLRPATLYRISWSKYIRGARGQKAEQELRTFATTRPSLTLADQAGFDDGTYTLRLAFNLPVRAETLASALRSRTDSDSEFRKNEHRAKVISSGTAREHRIRVTPVAAKWLSLRLDAGMPAAEGSLGLRNNVETLWRVDDADGEDVPEWAAGMDIGELKPVLSFQGMEGEWDADGTALVKVFTTSPLDSRVASKHIDIEPKVEFSCLSYWRGLKISGDFEPGKNYRITLRPGIDAGAAGRLKEPVTRNVWFDDKPPRLDFAYGGGYLLPDGMLKVPVTSVNTERFTLRLRKLYAVNLVELALRDYAPSVEEQYSGPTIERNFTPERHRNEPVRTLIDLRETLGDADATGVFGLEITPAGNRWRKRSATIVVSGIGLGARLGRGQLFAWTMSLSEGKSLAKAEIKVFSNKRRLLAEGVTGDDGTVSLQIPPLPDGERPVLVLAERDDDATFVHLGNQQNSRGSETGRGAQHPDAYQAFVATDRGVYRGGETVRTSLLVRDRELGDIPVMPIEIALEGPDGKTVAKTTRATDPNGRVLADIILPREAKSGIHTLVATLPGHDTAIGTASLQVADYIPEVFRLALAMDDGISPENPSRLSLRAERLAGGETGEVRARVLVEYRPAPFAPARWEGWSFGDGRIGEGEVKKVERDLRTDPSGTAEIAWPNPDPSSRAAVVMSVRVEVREPGGRVTSDSLSRSLHRSPYYLAVKPDSPRVDAGGEAVFSLAAVAPDGNGVLPPENWTAKLYRVEYNGLLKKRGDGRLVYEWQRREIPAGEESGSWGGGRAMLSLPGLAGGNYRLVVESGQGKAVTHDFSVYGGGGGWFGADPETLAVKAVGTRHGVGETATIVVSAPFAGQALVTVETDRVLRHWLRDMTAGENTFDIPVLDDMRPNAFVSVSLVRPTRAEKEWRPHRAVGAARIDLDNTDKRLTTTIVASESSAPGTPLSVRIKVENADGGAVGDAAVVLWGVDLGVLALTNFPTPSPWRHFTRTRRLGVVDADMYSRLAPELEEWRLGRDPTPGGGADMEMARRLNPLAADRVKAAVVFRGDLTTDDDGVAETVLDIPEFAGRMRLMAWSARGGRMGAGERELDVKAPVSFSASWPRFAAPGDEFRVAVTLTNRSGSDALVTLRAVGDEHLEISPADATVRVADETSECVYLRARALRTGVARPKLAASIESGEEFRGETELSVRPPVLFRRASGIAEIRPGDTERLAIAGDFLPDNAKISMTAGGNPQIKLAGALAYLVDYPHGCAEQTASRLAALLALPDLLSLSRPGQLGEPELGALVRGCVDRLYSLQARNGGFRMWPGSDGSEFWASAQILFLLEECRTLGLEIPKDMLEKCREYLVDNLDEYVGMIEKTEGEGERERNRYRNGADVALACLALAKGNALPRSWLIKLDEIAADRQTAGDPLAAQTLAFLCHATLTAGDAAMAQRMFDSHGPEGTVTGLFDAPAFAQAAWLDAGLGLGVPRARLAGLATRLERSLPDTFKNLTTRDNVWVLLSLGKYWRLFRPHPGSSARVTVNGVTKEFPLARGGNWANLKPGTEIEATVTGEDPLHLVWTAEGIPVSGGAKEEDVGMRARRRVFAPNGDELETPITLRQGDVVRVRLEIDATADDLVLADLLPAGLEIENPKLKGRDGEDTEGIDVEHVERKDDRLLLYGAVWHSGVYEYLCRAVTPGNYVWPALDAGRMYDPESRSVHGESRLTIETAEE